MPMLPSTATTLINEGITFMPGWDFSAEVYTGRHEHAVKVTLTYDTHDYSRRYAPEFAETVRPYACYVLDASKVDDVADLARALIGYAVHTFTHEAREALRIAPTWWGPFNPHTTGGQERWGDPQGDHTFGVV